MEKQYNNGGEAFVYQMVRKERHHISNDDVISQTVMTALIPTVSMMSG